MNGDRDHSPRLLLTVDDVADQLQIGRSTVYELLRAGVLRSIKVGRLRRIPASAVADAIAELERRAAYGEES